MDNYPQLVVKALKNAWSQKRTWFLGFIQILCLFLVLRRTNPVWWVFWPRVTWSLCLMLVFSLASVILWLNILAFEQGRTFVLGFSKLVVLALRVFGLIVLAVVFGTGLKFLRFHWTFFSLFSSLAAVSFTFAMLAAVLYNLSLGRSVSLALDFWKHKLSVICIAAFVVMLGDAYAFYFAHVFWPSTLSRGGGFSVSTPSATMVVVFLVLAAATAFFSALFNVFLVLLFLDVTKAKKAPEKLKSAVMQPVGNM